MITSQVNEITVWLDQQEDEGQDVSLSRILCSYNYLFDVMSFDHLGNMFNDENNFGNADDGDELLYMNWNGRDGHGDADDIGHGFGDGHGAGYGYGDGDFNYQRG